MDENNDEAFAGLRDELIGHGLYEIGMNKEDMTNLISALRNSEESAKTENLNRDSEKVIVSGSVNEEIENKVVTPSPVLERKYKNSAERRMPWVLFPQLDKLTSEQKSKILFKYKEQLNIYQYHRARKSTLFADWDYSFSIPLSKQKNSPDSKRYVHTRSGRTVRTLHYVDDGSDSESVQTEKKCRKRMKMKSSHEDVKSSRTQNFDNNVISADINVCAENNLDKKSASSFNCNEIDCPKPPKISKDTISKECSVKLSTWDIEI